MHQQQYLVQPTNTQVNPSFQPCNKIWQMEGYGSLAPPPLTRQERLLDKGGGCGGGGGTTVAREAFCVHWPCLEDVGPSFWAYGVFCKLCVPGGTRILTALLVTTPSGQDCRGHNVKSSNGQILTPCQTLPVHVSLWQCLKLAAL